MHIFKKGAERPQIKYVIGATDQAIGICRNLKGIAFRNRRLRMRVELGQL